MTIDWVSTRDPDRTRVDFREAMLRGLAPDGGLYVPTAFPARGPAPGADFGDYAVEFLLPWIGDAFDREDAIGAVREALDFPVPIREVEPGVHVLELFHGPTLSFKDFGARTMARLLDRIPEKETGQRVVFVATSGDTGSAVADGFAGLAGVRVVLLYPDGQVSAVQERQIAAPRPGVLAVRVDGSFDDCQRMVKTLFADPRFAPLRPTSANSINVGRLVPQMSYHGWAAGHRPGCTLVVPSGNLGNLTAALMAGETGAPIRDYVAAHNANRAFPDFLSGGPVPSGPSVRTLSNAMDVGTPSNFERMTAMFGARTLRRRVRGISVSDTETLGSIARVSDEIGYLADPHTAVGLEAARRLRSEGTAGPIVVVATAHPAKFPETVRRATGIEPGQPAELASLPDPIRSAPPCPATLDALLSRLEEGFSG